MKIKLIAFAVLTIATFNSCKKNIINDNDQLENTEMIRKFFSFEKTLPKEIEAVKNHLESENSKFSFVSKVVKLAGFPKWEKTIIKKKKDISSNIINNSNSNTYEYIIPTVSISNGMVMGAITIQPNNATPYHLVLLKDFAQHGIQKEQFLTEMMLLNNHVFGNDKFRILNNSLPNTQEILFIPKSNSSTSSNLDDDDCYEIEIWNNPNGDACHCDGDEYYSGVDMWVGNCTLQTTSVILPSDGGGSNSTLPSYYYPLVGLYNVGGSGNPNPPVPFYPVPTIQQKKSFLITELNLTLAQQSSLLADELINTLFDYLSLENNIKRRNFALWAIDYFSNNSSLNIEKFKNQFMTPLEGIDEPFDEAFWNNPSNSYPHQNLPTLANFKLFFPKRSDPLYNTSSKLHISIGGALLAHLGTSDLLNTCAARVSKALNYSGVIIPSIPGKTFKGADNFYYFTGAANLNAWLRKTFGCFNPNTSIGEYYSSSALHYSQSDITDYGSNLSIIFEGLEGIFSMVSSDPTWATGHADILLNSNTKMCDGGCHFDGPILFLDFWLLP